MPVYEVRFKPWEGQLRSPARRLLSIPKFTLMSSCNKRVYLAMFTGGVLPLLGFTGYLLVTTNDLIREMFGMTHVPTFGPSILFQRLLILQAFFAWLCALVAAPQMISTELANRALPLIYSRPISRFGYIIGKFLGLFFLLSGLTWAQSLVIWCVMFVLYPQAHGFHAEFWAESVPLLISSMFIGVLVAASLSLIALACSAATKSVRFGAVLYFAILAGASFITNFLQNTALDTFPNVGLREIFYHLGDKLVMGAESNPYHYWHLFLGIALWCGASLLFMLWRLRPVDVYGD